MFSTQEFFKNNPYSKLGSHAEQVAKWLLVKFRSKYKRLDGAIKAKKFDSSKFINEWTEVIRDLTPETIKHSWLYIDQHCNSDEYAPSILEFKTIASKNKRSIIVNEEDHKSAKHMQAAISTCYCVQCEDLRKRTTLELR